MYFLPLAVEIQEEITVDIKKRRHIFLNLKLPQIITTSVPVLYFQDRDHVLSTESVLCSLSGKSRGLDLAVSTGFGWWIHTSIQGGAKAAFPTITIYAWEWRGSEFSLQLFISCQEDLLGNSEKHLPCLNLQCTVHRALWRSGFFSVVFGSEMRLQIP